MFCCYLLEACFFVMRERKGVGLEERKGGVMVLLLENCAFILIHCGICKTLELESTEHRKHQTGWWDEPFPPCCPSGKRYDLLPFVLTVLEVADSALSYSGFTRCLFMASNIQFTISYINSFL